MTIERTISKDVFVSYAHEDESDARMIYDCILDHGGSAFFSSRDLAPGDDFAEQIREELQSARELWLLVTPTSIKSEWVLTEWGAAWALGMKIVPIFLRCNPADLPTRLRQKQGVDYHKYQALVERTFANRTGEKSPTEEERQLIDQLLSQDRIIHAISVGKPYLYSKRFDKCLPVFEYIRDNANKNHYDYYVVLGNIGYSLIGLGRNKEALECFAKVKEFHKGDTFFAWHALASAVAHLREGELEECRQMIVYAKTERTQQYKDILERTESDYPDLVPYLQE